MAGFTRLPWGGIATDRTIPCGLIDCVSHTPRQIAKKDATAY